MSICYGLHDYGVELSDKEKELLDRWKTETQRGSAYTLDELETLLGMAYDAESRLERTIGWNHGFISQDRILLERKIKGKKGDF